MICTQVTILFVPDYRKLIEIDDFLCFLFINM